MDHQNYVDKFAKEKARSRDKVLMRGAHPRGVDIQDGDEYLESDVSSKRKMKSIDLHPETIRALLHTQSLGFIQNRPFAPIRKGRRKAFIKALKDAGFRHERIRQAYFIMRAGAVLPSSWRRK